MTAEMQKKLQVLLENDEEFGKKVISATSISEEVSLLKEYGIDISEDELQQYGDMALKILKDDGYISEDGELSEKMLESVSGGKGWKIAGLGLGMMGTALLSDYLAGACAVAIVSNPAGWFIGGIAVCCAGAIIIGKSSRRK